MSKITSFFSEVIEELRKVTWPSRSETVKMTTVVIIVTIVVGAYVGGLDYGITKLLEQVVQ